MSFFVVRLFFFPHSFFFPSILFLFLNPFLFPQSFFFSSILFFPQSFLSPQSFLFPQSFFFSLKEQFQSNSFLDNFFQSILSFFLLPFRKQKKGENEVLPASVSMTSSIQHRSLAALMHGNLTMQKSDLAADPGDDQPRKTTRDTANVSTPTQFLYCIPIRRNPS